MNFDIVAQQDVVRHEFCHKFHLQRLQTVHMRMKSQKKLAKMLENPFLVVYSYIIIMQNVALLASLSSSRVPFWNKAYELVIPSYGVREKVVNVCKSLSCVYAVT